MNKISLRHFLFFSPYDNRYAYSQTLNINDFRKVRIIPRDFQDERENLKRIINPNFEKSFYILSGYSGNGKTTFVNWFKEQIEEENYYFEIINLIEKGNDNKNEALMSSCLKDKLSDLLLDKKVLNRIADNRAYFSATPISFTREQLQGVNIAVSNAAFDKESANYLLELFNFKQILILFLLHRVIQFVENDDLKGKESYTFCFDNLDELELEYLTPDMWQTILDVSFLMQQVLKISNITGFEFALKVKFVGSVSN